MTKIFCILLIFFFFQSNGNTSNTVNIINKLNKINNISFDFIQTIGGKDEKGECVIKYPKKIFCEYEKRKKKILVSNGSSLVIKNSDQYYRYPIKNTPFEYLLDKQFLLKKIKSAEINEIKDKYLFFQINENNNNINIFFSKDNYEIVGWQIEDIYQNLAVTYIFNTSINETIDEKIFLLPKND
tara:strand:- start:1157 stop:1708 length:552 start_codon:yes stop_codon:yes gene_type:complete